MMGCTAVWTAVHYRIPLLVRGGQQSLVLQRRGPPGAGGRRAQPPGREQVDRPAHQRSGHRHGADGARAGRQGLRPGATTPASSRRRSRKRSPWSRTAASRWSMRASCRATARRPPRRWRAEQGRPRQLRSADRRAWHGCDLRHTSCDRSGGEGHRADSGRRRHRQAFRDAGRRSHRRRRCVVHVDAGRIPVGDRAVRLRQVHAVQRHGRPARRLRGPRHASPARPCAGRMPRSA